MTPAEPGEAAAKVGPFVVSRVLGRGGMGIVYAGKHEGTGVEAAVKTGSKGSATFMSYVRHEASTLSRIRHPAVVQVLGFGVEAGRPWYAMELLSGRTLADVLDLVEIAHGNAHGRSWTTTTDVPDHPLAPREVETRKLGRGAGTAPQSLSSAATEDAPELASGSVPDHRLSARELLTGPSSRVPIACDLDRMLPIMRGICDALAFVHGEGVVHRDLKPENIFLREGELPVLVDFGLATQFVADGRDVLQNVASVAGSLSYMAPEQLRGELLDARCDLYALGCILYRVVTGRLPFQGTTWQVTAGHLMDLPVPAGQRVLGLPEALDELISGLLVKDRDQRVGSAEAVDAVLAAVGGRPCRWPAPLPPPQPFLYRPPFVGRRDVLGRLVERLERFAVPPDESGRAPHAGGLVLISGESGAGKTRLALEAVKHNSDASATTVMCGCSPGGGVFHPLRELFQALVEHCVASGPGEIERVFGAGAAVLALYSPAIAELPGVTALPEPEPLPSAAARARVFRCLSDTLCAFTRDRALLLLVDDLHLADSFTLGFLAHLQALRHDPLHDQGQPRATRAMPWMLVLGAYRSEERGPALDALAAHPDTLHLVVERMTELEVGQMVRGMLALADPPPAFVAFLARESGGNPFFVAEYLRTAVAERVLVRDGRGRWNIADTSVPTEAMCEALPLPRSLRQVVELRLGKLAARTRRVLDAAAVIGRRFSSALLGAVCGVDGDALLEALDEMVAAQVLEPIGDDRYGFVHDRLHELPAAALEPAQRRDLHARIAGAMEQIHAGATAEHDATIGRHWAQAGNPERAAPRLHAAADRARSIHSVDTAIDLYRAARQQLEQLATGPGGAGSATAAWREQARELDEKLGDALAFSSQHAPARAAFQQALSELGPPAPPTTTAAPGQSGREPERVIRARLLRKIAKTWESMHAYADALAGYAELDALIEASPDLAVELEPEWIQLMVGRAWIYYWSNRVDEMNAVIDRVRPIIEARGSALDRYRFYLALVTRDYRRDRYRISALTLELGRACVAAAREANAIGEIAFGRFVCGFGLLFARQLAEAEAEIEAGLQASRKISDAVAETRAIAYLALVHYLAGHRAEAETTATAALAMARARKMGDYEGMSLALLGRLARAAGNTDKAGELCRQAAATWNAMTYPFPFRWIAVLVLLDLGLRQGPGRMAASELARLARELTATTQAHLPDPLDEALCAAGDAGERGDDAAVEHHVRRAVELAGQLGYM